MSKASETAANKLKAGELPPWESTAEINRGGALAPMMRARVGDTGALVLDGFRVPLKEMPSFIAWLRLHFED